MEFVKRCWAEIDTAAIKHNFEIIKAAAGNTKIMPVVKANAYGHSVEIVAPILDSLGSDAFAVSNIDEAVELRNLGIKKPILILGYTPVSLAKALADNDISQCVYSKEFAEKLSANAKADGVTVKIHIKFDTGMCRIGFNAHTTEVIGADDAVYSAKLDNLKLEGVFTHFAYSDRSKAEEDGFTAIQFENFKAAVNKIKAAGLNPEVIHCRNSAAIFLDSEKAFDMSRPGIVLYGLTPSVSLDLKKDFVPVMTLKSAVSLVKTVKKGETVGYGRTFKTKKDMKIATVAAGYADGYPRVLSNNCYVLIGGKRADIVGRVCMDQMMVDVSNIDNVSIGDEVILFGKDLPVEYISGKANTINYETVCGISPRVPRIPV